MKIFARLPLHIWIVVLVLTLTTLIAAASHMSALERLLFDVVYVTLEPLRQLLLLVTQLGSPAMWLVSVVVAFAATYRRLAVQLLLGGGLALFVTVILKSLVARSRPFDLVDTITHYDRLATGFGYPSGHTAMAVCLAVTLWPVFPRAGRWALVTVAGLVAISRIGIGVHAPLDIIGGLCIGLLAAWLIQARYALNLKSPKNKT